MKKKPPKSLKTENRKQRRRGSFTFSFTVLPACHINFAAHFMQAAK